MADYRKLYAVFIDADNIPAKHAEAILKEVTQFGEPALRRAYGDWAQPGLSGWVEKIHDLGLVAYQITANTKGKNASDIGLVIDAMDMLHSGQFDGFVLVSSDSDFTRLANRIREQGIDVIGIGEDKAPKSLKKACNRFITLENITYASDSTPTEKTEPIKTKHPLKEAVPIILDAMNKIDPDGEWYHLGQLGKYIYADNPDFDTRTYGEAKLSGLLNTLNKFETKRINDQLHARRIN